MHRIRDARGLWHNAPAKINAVGPAGGMPSALARLNSLYGSLRSPVSRIGQRVVMLAVVLMGSGVMALVASEWEDMDRLPSVVAAVLGFGLFVLGGAGVCRVEWLLRRAIRREQTRIEALGGITRLTRCMACGYDLAGLGIDDDGCTVCPECGAAWVCEKPVE